MNRTKILLEGMFGTVLAKNPYNSKPPVKFVGSFVVINDCGLRAFSRFSKFKFIALNNSSRAIDYVEFLRSEMDGGYLEKHIFRSLMYDASRYAGLFYTLAKFDNTSETIILPEKYIKLADLS